MVAQVLAARDQGTARQVLALAVQVQAVVGQLGDDDRTALGPLQRDDDVRLAPRQVQQARQRQQVDGQLRVALRELRQVLRQDQRAKALGHAHAHQARGAAARHGRGALHAERGGFHGLDRGQQVAARFRQAVARRLAREQRGAQLFFQRLDAPRHGGVLHAQAARRGGQGAGTGEFEKVAQVVPVHACLIVQICKAKVQV